MIRKKNKLVSIVSQYIYDALLPININSLFQIGSLLGIVLIIQIISGVILGGNYINNIEITFKSIDTIMREVNTGWLIRYIHSNGSFFFFFLVYTHIFRALFYSSYILIETWFAGIFIFLLMIIIAFLGYCLPFGQMSFWGINCALWFN